MKKINLTNVLHFLLFASSLPVFYSIYRAIMVPDSSIWLVPILWVSLFVILLCLAGIFSKNLLHTKITILLSFFVSLFFSFTFVHFLITMACLAMVIRGLSEMRQDLNLNVKISLWKSLYVGKFKVILALSVLISSQYFFIIKTMEGPVNAPKFDFSSVSSKLVVPVLGFVNPQFSKAASENLTVDEFILRSQEDMMKSSVDESEKELIDANIPNNIPTAQREVLKKQAVEKVADAKFKLVQQNQQLILKEGRKQFSTIANKKIEGNEKVSDVFAGMVNDKINNYFQPNLNNPEKSTFLPFVLTLILFITIWPLGSLLSTFWFLIVILVYKLFVKYGIVKVRKEMIEREVIA